jgi:hypothetical protein
MLVARGPTSCCCSIPPKTPMPSLRLLQLLWPTARRMALPAQQMAPPAQRMEPTTRTAQRMDPPAQQMVSTARRM